MTAPHGSLTRHPKSWQMAIALLEDNPLVETPETK